MSYPPIEEAKKEIKEAFPDFPKLMEMERESPSSKKREMRERRAKALKRLLEDMPPEDRDADEAALFEKWEAEIRTHEAGIEGRRQFLKEKKEGQHSEYRQGGTPENETIGWYIEKLVEGGLSANRACELLAIVLLVEAPELVPLKKSIKTEEEKIFTIHERFKEIYATEKKGPAGFGMISLPFSGES